VYCVCMSICVVRNPDSTSEDIPPHKSHDSRLNDHLEFEVVQPHHNTLIKLGN
jgi:hypothetical protein